MAVTVQAQGFDGTKAVSAPSASTGQGLRASPGLRMHRLPDDKISAFMEADQIEGDPDAQLTLKGSAQVRRIDVVIKGDSIDYHKDTGDLYVKGSARMMRDGTLVTGLNAHFNIDTYKGDIDQPNFWLGANAGYVQAEHADIFSRSQMRLKQVTYTGCPCPKRSWYIKAGKLDLDFDENEGVAENGVLYFKGVPILASPYLTFPIKKERKSGLLMPTYGTTTRSGLDLSVPYYFNLAPNYDMTLTPRLLSRQGVLLNNEFRYMSGNYYGTAVGSYLPNDILTDRDRWVYRWKHRQLLGNGFYTDWDVARSSDDNYFRDISSIGLNEASTAYLPQQGRVGWADKYWQGYVQVYKYQTLQDIDAPIVPPFNKVPELSLDGVYYDWNGFDAEVNTSAVRFERPLFQGRRVGQDGDRFQVYPSLAYPVVKPSWYIKPKAGVHYTQYQTDWLTNTMQARSSFRSVPIMSLDSRMVFDRSTTLFGKSSVQTLEPRLFYLYVPYRDQSNLPSYDTTLANFSFWQAFEENIYSGGWDRIANANQVTAALTMRWLDESTGFERISISGAQRIYFENQKVLMPGELPRDQGRSDFLVAASAALTDTISTDVAAQYNPYNELWSRSLISARWSPQRLTTVALSYRYQREPYGSEIYWPNGQNQVSLAVQWPFSERWYGVARVDYSLRSEDAIDRSAGINNSAKSRVTQAIAGLEYKGNCCWTGRMVFQRYAVAAAQTNTALFFQLELTGLGLLGTDPMSLLNKSIPGYQQVNPPSPAGTTFERYE